MSVKDLFRPKQEKSKEISLICFSTQLGYLSIARLDFSIFGEVVTVFVFIVNIVNVNSRFILLRRHLHNCLHFHLSFEFGARVFPFNKLCGNVVEDLDLSFC